MKYLENVRDKTIIFGVSGGIAAYKAVNIVSRLRREGADVHVVLTENAAEFVSALTFKSLSANKVIGHMFPDEGYVSHISLTEMADLLIVAPATANILAKFTHGIADDMLSTMYLAYKGKILLVPSMNDNMYDHPATQYNLEILGKRDGHLIIEPDTGKLATGKVGKGRFPEDSKIFAAIDSVFSFSEPVNLRKTETVHHVKENGKKWAGKKMIVTCGATREYIDPVRFISNPSSGKMGYALAKAFAGMGAEVIVITGSYTEKKLEEFPLVKTESVESMYNAIEEYLGKGYDDLLVMSAAVSDYRVKDFSENKLKKNSPDRTFILELEKTRDILSSVRNGHPELKIIGFAAETENLLENGREKLEKKKMNAICINRVYKENNGFGRDVNTIVYLDKTGFHRIYENMPKMIIAEKIALEFVDKN